MPTAERDQITAQVTRAIKAAAPSFRLCYGQLAAQGKTPTGEITFELLIKPGGGIERLQRVSGSITNKKFVACTLRVIEELELPKPSTIYAIEAPLYFYPE